MTITRIQVEQFTAFGALDLALSTGINVFIGPNGTGKTHIMKVAYAACDVSKTGLNFAEKLIRVFLPSQRKLGRLVKRQKVSSRSSIVISRENLELRADFSSHSKVADGASIKGAKDWRSAPLESAYIPVKEMLSNAPGFRSLYSQREIHFEEIYSDILDRAYRPPLRGPVDRQRRKLLSMLQENMYGKVMIREEEFFLRNKQGNLELTLLAEGIRKLALLWLLIQNGTLLNGSVLFWDEPETNLNPKLYGPVIQILLELQRSGVQVFLATHDYVILKELDLRKDLGDKVIYHSLYTEENDENIKCHSTGDYLQLHPNAIQETLLDLFDRDVKRDLEDSSNG